MDLRGVVGAVRQAYQINVQKARGTYVDAIKATPYRRPANAVPDRTK